MLHSEEGAVGELGDTTLSRSTDEAPYYFWGLDTERGVWALATIVGRVEPIDPLCLDQETDTFGSPLEPAEFGAAPMPFTSGGRELVWEVQPHWSLRSLPAS